MKYKVSLVRCLFNRALRICSDGKLSDGLELLKEIFVRNGYPIGVINKFVWWSGPMDVGKVTTGQRVVFHLPYVKKLLVNVIVIWSIVLCLLFVVPLMM